MTLYIDDNLTPVSVPLMQYMFAEEDILHMLEEEKKEAS